MKIQRETVNVIHLALGFLLEYMTMTAHGFILQPVIDTKHKENVVDEHAGYRAAAISYLVFTFGNFLVPPLVGLLGPRWVLVIGSTLCTINMAIILVLTEPLLYFAACLVGLGGALLWTAQGKYLAMNSTEETASLHSNLFWCIYQICAVAGGVFLYFAFRTLEDNNRIEDSRIRTIYIIFTCILAVATVVLGLLRGPSKSLTAVNSETNPATMVVVINLVISTFKLLFTKRMALLAFTFVYTGLELSFTTGIYATSIAFTNKLASNTKTLIAFDAIAMGFGHITAGSLLGIFGKQLKVLGRIPIVSLGTALHICMFILAYLNFPNDAPLEETESVGTFNPPSPVLAVAGGYVLGFGDACWNTQIFSLLVSRYNKKSAEAFSLFKFFQCLAVSIAFFYSSNMKLIGHTIILIVMAILGYIGFVIAEVMRTPPEDIEDETPICTHC